MPLEIKSNYIRIVQSFAPSQKGPVSLTCTICLEHDKQEAARLRASEAGIRSTDVTLTRETLSTGDNIFWGTCKRCGTGFICRVV